MARPRKAEREKRRRRDIWLSDDEWAEIERRAKAARLPTRQYIRRAALGKRVEPMPSVENLEAWRDLARVTANLNQLARHANETGEVKTTELQPVLAELRADVEALRAELIGADAAQDDDDDGWREVAT